ncbi:MAG: hypothetical protein K2P74_04435 [Nitrosomonas sp.]|nr:hypothetical protein [Nitrosomonas sp.]
MNKSYDAKTIQARIRILNALKIATKEAKKLNSILDDMHNMLEANAAKKAA